MNANLTKCLCLIAALVTANVFGLETNGVAYHPYRKVIIDGEWRYFSLQPLYEWHARAMKWRRGDEPLERPMPAWIGGATAGSDGETSFYRVLGVHADGLLMETSFVAGLRVIKPGTGVFFLKNYPRQKELVDGQQIYFFALRVGTYHYEDLSGGTHTVPCYDYGIPYDPNALARQVKARNDATNKPPIADNPTQ